MYPTLAVCVCTRMIYNTVQMIWAININPDVIEHRDYFSRTYDNLQSRPENPPAACPAEDVIVPVITIKEEPTS